MKKNTKKTRKTVGKKLTAMPWMVRSEYRDSVTKDESGNRVPTRVAGKDSSMDFDPINLCSHLIVGENNPDLLEFVDGLTREQRGEVFGRVSPSSILGKVLQREDFPIFTVMEKMQEDERACVYVLILAQTIHALHQLKNKTANKIKTTEALEWLRPIWKC